MGGNDLDDGPMPTEPEVSMVTSDYQIQLADGWTEKSFERGTYGSEDTPGVEAQFTAAENTELRIDPVEYDVVGRRRRIQGLEADFESRVHSDDVATEARKSGGQIYEPCLFAVRAYYAPISSPEVSTYTLTTDADDALAAVCWLSHATDPMSLGQAIERALQAQAGEDPDHYGIDYPTDEERIENVFVEDPNRCFYSGKTTRSHLLRLPFRYAPLLEGYPENAEALPAVPSRVGGFEVAVSHTEWSDRGLSEGQLEEPIEHVDTGVYQLPHDVAEQADGFPVEATSFRQK
ncbi:MULTISPECIES: hypothetical protein [unclassified Haloferax]|jgi:hypothetical protein|uniref:hypothetical protein n=1 Tax=unclassified Haloferax TaxID=2625095 RepID=UPI002873F739|nr:MULTISPECIES: hypothetical protein [unclassified Haloferax]MDS0243174.1 hypothetical protein [Haloferax sp. S2CR25]MDS0446295.1 hypothetical protein [Haloferax sp. S2CR25-2]